MKMRHGLAPAAALVVALAAAGARAEVQHVKLGFFTNEQEMTWVSVIKPFVDAVNRDGKDVIQIDAYTNGALGRDLTQQAQLILDGVTDIAFTVPGYQPGRFADNGVMELPGLARDVNDSTLLFTRLMAKNELRGYENFYVIGAIGTPPSYIHSRVKIATVDDIKGKKVRTANATEALAFKALDGVPVLIPITEAAEGIGRGTIDAVSTHLGTLFDFGIDRVTTSHYLLRIGYSPLAIMMNRKKFEALSPEAQAVIRKYSGEWFAETYAKGYQAYVDKLLAQLQADPKHHVIEPTPADVEKAQALFQPVYDEWAKKDPHNPELLKDARAELDRIHAGK
jgi:TRAP-type C4-dicarboxylate transport system substrate-binding protein